jgi:hypothetical protein
MNQRSIKRRTAKQKGFWGAWARLVIAALGGSFGVAQRFQRCDQA